MAKIKFMKLIKNILSNLLVVFSVLILILASMGYYFNKGNTQDTYLMGYKPVYVMTGSMEPTLRVNGVAILKQVPFEDVEVGDIISFDINDMFITHRVIERKDDGFLTKGDNNDVEDSFIVGKEHYKSKVVYILNFTAPIVNELSTSAGKVKWISILLGSVLVLFVINRLVSILVFRQKNIFRRPNIFNSTPLFLTEKIDVDDYSISVYTSNSKNNNESKKQNKNKKRKR